MAKQGKRIRAARDGINPAKSYDLAEAVKMIKARAKAKFDETVEVAMNLGVDPRHADQMVRGVCNLPNGSGRTVRVAVFARGAKADEAKAAGADIVGGTDLIEKIQAGQELEADVAIATPSMMAEVGKLGRVLGPRGLMPNPKSGTVTDDVAKAVAEFKGGKIEYRNDRYGNVHVPLGKVSFDVDQLYENLAALTAEIQRARPAGSKGRYIKGITVSSTMGPGIKVDPVRLEEMAKAV